MQIFSLPAALLTLAGACVGAGASSLRRPGGGQRLEVAATGAPGSAAVALKGGQTPPAKASVLAGYEVVEKKSIERKVSADCLCKMGSFWHWRIKACVKQGGWAYECGFFPAEHHARVCQDGLKCVPVNQSRVEYFHPGAVPASCQPCQKEDTGSECLTGMKRHEQDCLKEYGLSGSACQTVRVSAVATASATATEKVTKSGTVASEATATATEEATATKGSETATATKKATAEGQATATAEASSKASAKAKATKKATADGKACISLDEVKRLMDLEGVPRIGAVLSAEVVARGDQEAFDRAHAKAIEAARAAGLLSAMDAAKALASAKAREHAGLEAAAKAEAAAAWKAEAGAEEAAQDNAKAEALAKAQAAAAKEAAAAAAAAAEAAADAKSAEAAGGAAAKEARAKADAAAAAAAEAKARQEAISDVVNSRPRQQPARPTTAEPTSPPRKITPEQIAAKLP